MAEILELRELSFAVRDLDKAQEKFNAMGLDNTDPWTESMPPIQARLTSMPIGGSSISLMESVGDEDTPITEFLEKRGEGIFSFTLVVDDIEAITEQWRNAGVDFVLDEPVRVPNGYSVGQPIPVILGNWTRPSTLHGIVIELQEFQNEDGSPYRPPGRPSV